MLNTHVVVVLGAFVLLDVVREALRHADISLTKAAAWQEMDVNQFHRQLNGVEHLSLRRLEKLPLRFHCWFAWLYLMKVGMPKEVRRAAVVQLAIIGRRRMLRLEKAAEKAEQAS